MKTVLMSLILSLATAVVAGPAQAAKIEFRTNKSLKSADLESLRDAFDGLVDMSEQTQNGDVGLEFLPEKISARIVTMKSTEKIEQVLKQVVHAIGRNLEKGTRITELLDPNAFEAAYQDSISPMSWTESSPVEDMARSLEPLLSRKDVRTFSVETNRGDSYSKLVAYLDTTTNEVVILGTRVGL